MKMIKHLSLMLLTIGCLLAFASQVVPIQTSSYFEASVQSEVIVTAIEVSVASFVIGMILFIALSSLVQSKYKMNLIRAFGGLKREAFAIYEVGWRSLKKE